MNKAYNYITLHHPNLPIPSSLPVDKPLGKFIDAVVDEEHMLEGSVAVMKSQDMYLPNFSLRVIDGVFSQDAVFSNLKTEGIDLLSSCLFLKGTLSTALTEQNRVVESFDWSQNFKFDPDNKYVHRCPAHRRLHFIHFSYHPEYFKQFLSEQEKWAEQFITKIEKRERILGGQYQPITFVQERALQNLFDCPIDGRLGEVMLETSILQVVLIQMHLLLITRGRMCPLPCLKKIWK